jgi:hypothetical protein
MHALRDDVRPTGAHRREGVSPRRGGGGGAPASAAIPIDGGMTISSVTLFTSLGSDKLVDVPPHASGFRSSELDAPGLACISGTAKMTRRTSTSSSGWHASPWPP